MVTLGRSALAKLDLLISRGADFEATVRYKAGDPPAGVDLTGWSARAQVREMPGGDVWLTLTHTEGITLGADGTIRLAFGYARTRADAWNRRRTGVWDLKLTDPNGHRIRLAEGAVTVSQDVTRDA